MLARLAHLCQSGGQQDLPISYGILPSRSSMSCEVAVPGNTLARRSFCGHKLSKAKQETCASESRCMRARRHVPGTWYTSLISGTW